MPWYPEDGDGTPQPFPFTLTDVLNKMAERGQLPGQQDPAGDDGPQMGIEVQLPAQWRAGQPLPHTSMSFDDPMGKADLGEWKALLTGAARESGDVEELTGVLLCTVGRDMVQAHGVPVQAAFDGTVAYAKWLYGEYHDAG